MKELRKDIRVIVSLTIALAVCKAGGIITISWVWVFSPIWIYFGPLLAAFLTGCVIGCFKARKNRGKR